MTTQSTRQLYLLNEQPRHQQPDTARCNLLQAILQQSSSCNGLQSYLLHSTSNGSWDLGMLLMTPQLSGQRSFLEGLQRQGIGWLMGTGGQDKRE